MEVQEENRCRERLSFPARTTFHGRLTFQFCERGKAYLPFGKYSQYPDAWQAINWLSESKWTPRMIRRPKKTGGDQVKSSKIRACPNLRNQTSTNSEWSCLGSARSFGDGSSSEAIQPSLIYTTPYKSPLAGPMTIFTCPYRKLHPRDEHCFFLRNSESFCLCREA
jgi:hypothetical protein